MYILDFLKMMCPREKELIGMQMGQSIKVNLWMGGGSGLDIFSILKDMFDG